MPYELTLRRVATARRARLRIDAASAVVRLTVPPRMSAARAIAWAEEQRGWIEARLAELPAPRPLGPDATIPWRGRDITIRWSIALSRTPRLEGDILLVGGAREAVARRVLAWARTEALAILTGETRQLAAIAAVTVARVSVGDPRSRWGSCSASGNIRYSWRLAMAPPDVLSATVAHEVAHRLHMDHSPAFHDAERRLLGRDPAPPRAWLRRHGAALLQVGRGVCAGADG